MDLSIVSQFMSLTPDMMYKATKMVETVQSYFPGDVDAQEKYLNENLIDQTLEYALTLLEDKKVRDYMDVAVYTNGKTFSAPTLALYNVASMPEMKQRIQAKLNARGGMKKEELELQERKMSKAAHKRAARAGKRWQDSDCDGEWYEPGDDVGKTRTRKTRTRKARNEAVDYVAELWKGRHGQSEKEYQDGRSDAGKRISGDSSTGPRYYTLGRSRGAKPDAPTAPGARPVNTPKLSSSEKEYHQYNKSSAKNRAQYNRVGGSKGLPEEVEMVSEEDPCWKGYTQVGMKKKGGREVPNCVPSKGVPKAKGYKKEDIEFVADFLISEGLNEYGIDILIEEMGLDDFCDFVDEISTEEVLLEWRRGAGGTKVRGSGMAKSGTPIRSIYGAAKTKSIEATPEHKARKAEREREPSKTSGMKAALQSQSKIAMAKRSQPETKSTPTQTKEKSKGGILGALQARAKRDTKLLKKTINTAGNVAARRAAEVAGVTVGVSRYIGKKMKQEEKELLTHYFLESEIAFNYDEVQEIFESLDQEHFDYFLEQAMLMVEESGPSAREIIEETLYNTFDIERFAFADWRQLTEKNSGDEATGKFVSLTQTNRTDNTPDVRGRRKDGVIINPQVDMRCEDEDLENYQRSTQSSIDKVRKTKDQMVTRASADIAARNLERTVRAASRYGPQRQKPGTVGAYRREH